MPRRRPDSETNTELPRPCAYGESEDPGDADDRDRQRQLPQTSEDQRIQPVGRKHLGANIFERRGLLTGWSADSSRMILVIDGTSVYGSVRACTNMRPPPISCSNG